LCTESAECGSRTKQGRGTVKTIKQLDSLFPLVSSTQSLQQTHRFAMKFVCADSTALISSLIIVPYFEVISDIIN
jgi:hypothetical protein